MPTLRQVRASRAAEEAAAAATTGDGSAGEDDVDGRVSLPPTLTTDGIVIPTLSELFPPNSKCFLLSGKYYGSAVTVRVAVEVFPMEVPFVR